jgi:hypothetical protein
VYFTLIPLFFVKSEGVNLAMSCIWPFATTATLIVLAELLPDAAPANDAAMTAAAMSRTATSARGLRTLQILLPCMVAASSEGVAVGVERETFSSSRQRLVV